MPANTTKTSKVAAKRSQCIASGFAETIATHSSYLRRIAAKYPDFFAQLQQTDINHILLDLLQESTNFDTYNSKKNELMDFLRAQKAKLSLLVAAADIQELWSLQQITTALSDFADIACQKSLEFLLTQGFAEKNLSSANQSDSGIVLLAVGKLGSRELNYSSDIDLIFFYDNEKNSYCGRSSAKQFFIKLCNDFVGIMQERTGEGYVFRVDLRLRPDPYSTPVAVSTQAAKNYYENVGQNWERAAMIKARFVAGDELTGEDYIKFLQGYVWRKYLDFAALNDIHSIKRQIDSSKNFRADNLLGYNIKLGKGGIREIEFYVQVQQLIWGGREANLRHAATCATLTQLEALGRISAIAAKELTEIYEFYRKVEHRLQMVADEHTHSLPEKTEDFAKFALFLGESSVQKFEQKLKKSLTKVQAYYAELFTNSPSLSAGGNLMFTGVSSDPETLMTLGKLGFKEAEKICEIIRGWHHGRRRATRFKKVRELLTELIPNILKYFSQTGDPDVALIKFDAFLSDLPSGVQLFSLFTEKPELIELFADIMGDSPWLAENFSRSPALVNRLLTSDFRSQFPEFVQLQRELSKALSTVDDAESQCKILRRWKHDMEFQVGVRLLKKLISHKQASLALSNIAELVIVNILQILAAEIGLSSSEIANKVSIIAMGKLGTRELTFGSDVDLVFVHNDNVNSAELQPLTKLAQKFLQTVTNLSADGMLYKADTRLRPQGEQGALLPSLLAFEKYYHNSAWNWEFLALTKARVLNFGGNFSSAVANKLATILNQQREPEKLEQDILVMRQKIAASHPDSDPWRLKYARGGIFELEFIIQYLALKHTEIYAQSASPEEFLLALQQQGKLPAKRVTELWQANDFIKKLQAIVRLISKSGFVGSKASANQKSILLEFFAEKNFDSVERKLLSTQAIVNKIFRHMFEKQP